MTDQIVRRNSSGTFGVFTGDIFCIILNQSGEVWQTTTDTFVTFVLANAADYWITFTDVNPGIDTLYTATFPSLMPSGQYWILTYQADTTPDFTANLFYSINFNGSSVDFLDLYQWNGSNFGTPNSNKYVANITLGLDSTENRYVITWFENAVEYTTALTSPTIQVIKTSDGTDFIGVTAMTQISGAHYKYVETSTLIDQSSINSYIVVISGTTVDGVNISYSKIIGVKNGVVTY